MSTFDKREEGFERKFAHDEELRFKATARRNKPIAVEFETERSLSIVSVIDTGRLMRPPVGDIAKVDYAINAALLLIADPDSGNGEELDRDYYDAAAQPKTLWEIPGAGHVNGVTSRSAEYERRVIGFLDRYLAS